MSEHHDHSHAVVTEENSKKLMVALGLTTTFLIVEVVAAFITQSLALLSDAPFIFRLPSALAERIFIEIKFMTKPMTATIIIPTL